MYCVRRWAVRHSAFLHGIYRRFDWLLRRVRPLARRLGRRRLEPAVAVVERQVKAFLFDCRMCGDCVLSKTGMSCPMNCPKELRNGPCGGVREDGSCEVDAHKPCVWVDAWHGSQSMPTVAFDAPITPLDHDHRGRSSWCSVLLDDAKPSALPVTTAAETTSGSRLETLLRAGEFVVTSECSPPDSANAEDVSRLLPHYEGFVDALNVTDAPGAHCHMSSMGTSLLLARAGWEPVMQINCRDRNRIAIQGDILAAAALGIRNLLCITGDAAGNGDDPGAKPVFDLDALTLLDTARRLRDKGLYRSGRRLTSPPALFLGAVENPFVPPVDLRPLRLARKIAAGAQFVQTQFCFDVPLLRRFMQRIRDDGLDEQCFILVGVGVIVSSRSARWIRARVPGVHIPESVISRLATARDATQEGTRIAVETLQEIRTIPGVAGAHIMAPKQEHLIGEIVTSSGTLDRRQLRPIQTRKESNVDSGPAHHW